MNVEPSVRPSECSTAANYQPHTHTHRQSVTGVDSGGCLTSSGQDSFDTSKYKCRRRTSGEGGSGGVGVVGASSWKTKCLQCPAELPVWFTSQLTDYKGCSSVEISRNQKE